MIKLSDYDKIAIENKICPVCKSEFTSIRDNHVFCSTKCRNSTSRPEVKERVDAYFSKPEAVENRRKTKREYDQKPEVSEKRRIYQREYEKKPEVSEKRRIYQRDYVNNLPPDRSQKRRDERAAGERERQKKFLETATPEEIEEAKKNKRENERIRYYLNKGVALEDIPPVRQRGKVNKNQKQDLIDLIHKSLKERLHEQEVRKNKSDFIPLEGTESTTYDRIDPEEYNKLDPEDPNRNILKLSDTDTERMCSYDGCKKMFTPMTDTNQKYCSQRCRDLGHGHDLDFKYDTGVDQLRYKKKKNVMYPITSGDLTNGPIHVVKNCTLVGTVVTMCGIKIPSSDSNWRPLDEKLHPATCSACRQSGKY